MNFKKLSDNQLLTNLKSTCASEKDFTLRILKLLLEVEQRRLYLPRGYPSLFAFCTKFLGYSENEAFTRIQGMRLMRELPSVEEKLASGEISLTAAAKAQTVFRRVEKQTAGLDRSRKSQIMDELCGVNVREAEQRLANHFPNQVKSEFQRAVNADLVQISLTVSTELLGKLERLKGLLAHKNPEGRMDGLMEVLADFALSHLDPMVNAPLSYSKRDSQKRAEANQGAEGGSSQGAGMQHVSATGLSTSSGLGTSSGSTTRSGSSARTRDQGSIQLSSTTQVGGRANAERGDSASGFGGLDDAGSLWSNKARSRHIPKVVRWRVWQRAGACCEYVDDETGTRCGSRFKLQIDHVQPFAAGGGHDESNLQLLCAPHNLWRSNGVFQLAHQRVIQLQSTVVGDQRWQSLGS